MYFMTPQTICYRYVTTYLIKNKHKSLVDLTIPTPQLLFSLFYTLATAQTCMTLWPCHLFMYNRDKVIVSSFSYCIEV